MQTTTKRRVIPARTIELWHRYPGSYNYTTTLPGYTEEISYQLGPKYDNGHNLWKSCTHDTYNKISGPVGHWVTPQEGPWHTEGTILPIQNFNARAPVADLDGNVLSGIWDQLDLNCHDGVLLYSGILQAVPLLGGALRFNRIMRDLAKRLKRDFLKKPFTTVIKSAISLDFIDRFVVSPTIDDARKFADATDYVLRVINTAQSRNDQPFALSAESTTTFRDQSRSGTSTIPGMSIMYDWQERTRSYSTTKMFALIEGRYSLAAIDPIKLWAARVGLTRPLESAWDLVPFSFVVDYFTRAGDFIAGLSDEMSDQDGLRAIVSRIHGLWYTLKNSYSVECNCSPAYLRGFDIRGTGGKALAESTHFVRAPVPDAWSRVLSLPTGIGEFVNIDVGVTRGRTLAELFIQAKL